MSGSVEGNDDHLVEVAWGGTHQGIKEDYRSRQRPAQLRLDC